jgi:hypothetical protein
MVTLQRNVVEGVVEGHLANGTRLSTASKAPLKRLD